APDHPSSGTSRATAEGDDMRTRSDDSASGTRMRVVALFAAIAATVCVLATPAVGQVTNAQPKATDVGVTPSEIHIALIADVDNPLVPGLFAGSRDAAFAFAKYINGSCAAKNKCLAGRKLVVDFYDPHLNVSQNSQDEILDSTDVHAT